MKLSKEEMKKKISEKIVDNEDLVIELLEDIEDSFEDGTPDLSELEELKTKYEELKGKYKERFLSKEVKEELEDDDNYEDETKIIDIKEI